MVEQSFGLFFFLKQPKSQKSKNQRFVYLKITVDGHSSELSTKRLWDASKWSKHQGRGSGTSEEVKTFNAQLAAIEVQVYVAKTYLLNRGLEISSQAIKDVMLGRRDDNKTILKVFREHNERMKALVNKEYAKGTLQRYETSYSHTADFIKAIYRKDDLPLGDLNYEFVDGYFHWLKSVRNCGQNSAAKYIGNFKKIVLECVKKGWLLKDPFVNFKAKIKQVEKIALNPGELKRIQEKKFDTLRLSTVRDIFLFSCYTGLAYIDVKSLQQNNIETMADGEQWIVTKRTKTDVAVRVPLLPVALDIIKKYSDHPIVKEKDCVLPIATNQKVNEYLKEIASVCNIDKTLTFHIARHTFATTITLNNGVSLESVSKMLGHSSIRQTQHYAKILDSKVSSDMNRLKGIM